jgi:hypothetical protein
MRFIRFPFFYAEYFARLYAFAHLRKVLFKAKTCVSYVFHFPTRNILPDYMHLHICAKYCSKQKYAFHTFFIFLRWIFCQIICICTFAQSIVRNKSMRFIRVPFFRAAYFVRLYAFVHLRKVLFKKKHAFHKFSIFSSGICCQILCICTFAQRMFRTKTCVSYICAKYFSAKRHAFHTFVNFHLFLDISPTYFPNIFCKKKQKPRFTNKSPDKQDGCQWPVRATNRSPGSLTEAQTNKMCF